MIRLFAFVVFFAGVLGVPDSRAQNDNPFHLPEGALARLGKGRLGGGDRTVVHSPDGTRLAVATDVGIWLYEARTGTEVALLEGHTWPVNSISFSPDGKTLASGGEDMTVRLWDVDRGLETAKLQGHTWYVNSVSFSPDGKTLASGGEDDGVRLWDVNSRQETATLHHLGYVKSVSFSPDGKTLASVGYGWKVRLWDVVSRQEIGTLQGHTRYVNSVSFSPDGRTLASGSGDGTVRLWDVDRGQEIATLPNHMGDVNSMSFSPDGKTLVSAGDDGTVRLWDVDRGLETAPLEYEAEGIVEAWLEILESGQVTAAGQEIVTLHGHTGYVKSVSFSPDGRTLASGGEDNTVRLWDLVSGQVTDTLYLDTRSVYSLNSVSFSPDGRTLAIGVDASWDEEDTVWLWDLASGQVTDTLSLGPYHVYIEPVFSPDGRTLAIGGYDGVRLWDMDNDHVTVLQGNTYAVREVSFSPDGRTLASAEGIFEMMYLGVSEGAVTLWDVDSGQVTAKLMGHTDPVNSVLFSPDGRMLASGGDDNMVRLWDLDSGQETATLQSRGWGVRSVSFSPDGQTLASFGYAAITVLLWDMSPYVIPVTAVESASHSLPERTALLANYPNPFNAGTWIVYRLAAPGPVRLEVYNVLGQRVRTLVDEFQNPGSYQVHWEARSQKGTPAAAGVYVTRLQYSGGEQTRRLLLLK